MKDWLQRHKILAVLLLLILLLDLGGLAFVWGKLNLLQYDPNDRHDGADGHPGGVITKVDIPERADEDNWGQEDVVNILLVGTDERVEEFSVNARSDSMILLSLNKEAKTIKLVSLQRGIGVPVLEGIYEGEKTCHCESRYFQDEGIFVHNIYTLYEMSQEFFCPEAEEFFLYQNLSKRH